MSKFHIAFIASFTTSVVMAADFGVGIGINGSGSTIYVPIDIDATIRLEPYLNAHQNRSDDGQTSSKNGYVALGSGLFKVTRPSDNVHLLIGARVAYVMQKNDYSNHGTYSNYTSNQHLYGWQVAPTINFEYFLQPNISIGGEASIIYTKTHGPISGSESNAGQSKSTSTDTFTAATVKYYFK